ncbi:MAG: hypothetical protein IKA72_05400 [Clostridia bacterium]|nr:hypothetical protein [Clostridia bacterium]
MEKRAYEDENKKEELRRKKVVQEVVSDFERRREARRSIENGWVLNMNFVSGNQYCDVSPFGEIVEEEKRFYWQTRRVFNHIAPLIDARVAKLLKRKPNLKVRAFSDEDGDVKTAKLASGILRYVNDCIDLEGIYAKGTVWSEVCGTAFYKTLWNDKGGRQVGIDEQGLPVYEGEVEITVAPPFEIFPDRLDVEGLEEVGSLIHAQAVGVGYVLEKFGVSVQAEDLSSSSVCAYSEPTSGKNFVMGGISKTNALNCVLLLERYTRPNADFPLGRLEIVAGGELLYEGDLPYLCDKREERGFPFVKQDCMRLPGAFFASSIVDRLIPVQRAYNAVRNRKHEFLSRIAAGVFAVEDGSVDIDALEEEGLAPGKIVVYRQGAKAPEALDCGSFPAEFAKEEEWLEKEFSLVSGVSDLSQNSTPVRVTSATGLQLLLSQDDSRLSATMESLKLVIKEIAARTLRLYRQFAGNARLMSLSGENGKVCVHYFNASEVPETDVSFEFEELETSDSKREVLLKLLQAGLLMDDDGKVSKENKERILEAFGFGGYENAKDISSLHCAKATEENIAIKQTDVEVDEYDDHAVHITEHTRFLLSEGVKNTQQWGEVKKRFVEHIRKHKELL